MGYSILHLERSRKSDIFSSNQMTFTMPCAKNTRGGKVNFLEYRGYIIVYRNTSPLGELVRYELKPIPKREDFILQYDKKCIFIIQWNGYTECFINSRKNANCYLVISIVTFKEDSLDISRYI